MSLGGGVIGAMHIPEKWFPGTVDRCLNSHNIMHVLVVLAVYSMHQVSRILIFSNRSQRIVYESKPVLVLVDCTLLFLFILI